MTTTKESSLKKLCEDLHKPFSGMIELNPHFEEDNFDAQQPERVKYPESDEEIAAEQAREEQAYEHAHN